MPAEQAVERTRRWGRGCDGSSDAGEGFEGVHGAYDLHVLAARRADPVARQHHAVKVLHKAVKKSRTFELQKLTRKLKSTR